MHARAPSRSETTLSIRSAGSSREVSRLWCQGCWNRRVRRAGREDWRDRPLSEVIGRPGHAWAAQGRLIYPRGLNSGKNAVQTCIRSCPVYVKWTIPVGVCSAVSTGRGQRGGMGETVRRVSERHRPCVSDRSRRVDIRHDPSFTSPRCRGGSGSPPESWRRRGLEHGIHPRRRPSRSDRAERDCRSNHGPGDRFSHITQLITIGAAERLRDDGETPRCASPPTFQAETHTRTRSKRSAASTGPSRPGSRTRSKPVQIQSISEDAEMTIRLKLS